MEGIASSPIPVLATCITFSAMASGELDKASSLCKSEKQCCEFDKQQVQCNRDFVVFGGSDDELTSTDVYKTIKEYRKNNPDGKIALVGHSLGGKDVMDAALRVANDKEIKNNTIDLVITLEPATVGAKSGIPYYLELKSNVKQMINYTSASPSYAGAGGDIEGADQNSVLNQTLSSGTNHTNMDNTLVGAINKVLTRLGNNKNPIKAAKEVDYSKLKIYNNGDRIEGAEGGTSD